jgi:hypothetical protein
MVEANAGGTLTPQRGGTSRPTLPQTMTGQGRPQSRPHQFCSNYNLS